jgi:hypothetical protein
LAALLTISSSSAEAQHRDQIKATLQCFDRQRDRDEFTAVARCEPLSARRTIRGLWITGFETSEFLQGMEAPPRKVRLSGQETWLYFRNGAEQRYFDYKTGQLRAYLIKFVGRNTLVHDGRFTFLVDRLISIRAVEVPAVVVNLPPAKALRHH